MASQDIGQNLRDNNNNWIAVRDALVRKGASVQNKTTADYADIIDDLPSGATLQSKNVNPSTSQQVVEPDSGYDGLSEVTVNPVTSSIDVNITQNNIKKDVTILGVTGTYEGGAQPTLESKTVKSQIHQDQTVYPSSGYNGISEVLVQGINAQYKEVTPSGDYQLVTPDSGYDALIQVTVDPVSLQSKTASPSDSTQYIEPDSGYSGLSQVEIEPISLQSKTVTPSDSTQYIEPDSGYNGLSQVEVEPISLQNKSATPSTSSQTIEPDSGYNGLSEVNISGVDSTIDNNIQSANIKKDITILGVTGTYEGEGELPPVIYDNYETLATYNPGSVWYGSRTLFDRNGILNAIIYGNHCTYDKDNDQWTRINQDYNILGKRVGAAVYGFDIPNAGILIGDRLYWLEKNQTYNNRLNLSYYDLITLTVVNNKMEEVTLSSQIKINTIIEHNGEIYFYDTGNKIIGKITIAADGTGTYTLVYDNSLTNYNIQRMESYEGDLVFVTDTNLYKLDSGVVSLIDVNIGGESGYGLRRDLVSVEGWGLLVGTGTASASAGARGWYKVVKESGVYSSSLYKNVDHFNLDGSYAVSEGKLYRLMNNQNQEELKVQNFFYCVGENFKGIINLSAGNTSAITNINIKDINKIQISPF